ncbi:MAG: thymidylate synthase [Candidatus Pacebacteria bacterium]|nr:thymidylate synthase [Candidatus Paceibacterota bacterium]
MEGFLNPVVVDARDLPEAWFLCLQKVLEVGFEYEITRGSFKNSKRKELDFVTVYIRHPGTMPLVPDVPQGVDAPTTMAYVESYLPYLMTSAKEKNEQYTYGEFLEPQIPKVIKMFKETGSGNNQACMTIGDKNSIDLSDPPCLRLVDARIRYGKLHFMVYFRSWDLWAGFPSNLAALQLLKEYMASEIGVYDGEIVACSKGLHLYKYAWDPAKTVLRI